MYNPKRISLLLAGMTLIVGGLGVSLAPADAPHTDPVKIGMVRSLFADIPQILISWGADSFTGLMKKMTGIEGKAVIGGDAYHVGKLLHDKKIQIGVFHGHEFGWAQQKFPDIKAFMIAIDKQRYLRANLVVRNDSKVTGFADLKGKVLGLPYKTKAHCKLYLEHNCQECGHVAPKAYFGQVTTPANILAALDEVLVGTIQATVVDNVSLDVYQDIKPGCFARLKVVKQSEVFPSAIIAYKEGALDVDTLGKFRDGMLKANQTEEGRDMMFMFGITSFEPVPADYPQILTSLLRIYPAPEPKSPVKVETSH